MQNYTEDTQKARGRKIGPGSFALGCLSGICALSMCSGIALSSAAQVLSQRSPEVAEAIAKLATPQAAARAAVTPEATTDEPQREATATSGGASAELPTDEKEFQREIWTELWGIVDEYYAYTDFRGVDWKAKEGDFRKRIDEGLTREAFYEAISEEIDAFKDDHSGFYAPWQVAQLAEREGFGFGMSMSTNPRSNALYVLSVDAGSPAELAGVKPHMRVTSINGVIATQPDGTVGDYEIDYEPEAKNRFVMTDIGGAKKTFTLVRRRFAVAEDRHSYRLLPAAKTGGKKIGYLFVPTFSGSFAAASFTSNLDALMREADGELDGLIVDVRANAGGSEWVLQRVFATLSTEDLIGFNKSRDGERTDLRLDGRDDKIGNSQDVPVAVLIGSDTVSAAEIFAGCLKAQYPERVTLVGMRTLGNIEGVQTFELNDGSELALAVHTFHRPDGSTWEDKGLEPDIPVDKAWDEVMPGKDPVIDAAINVLRK
jgi:carboxyl-terminal processing protease